MVFKFSNYILFFVFALSFINIKAQNLSNFRINTVSTNNDTIYIDSNAIILSSVKVFDLNNNIVNANVYKINEFRSFLYWKEKPNSDSIKMEYRIYPYQFSKRVFTNDYNKYKNYKNNVGFLINTNIEDNGRTESGFIDFGKLSYDGDFSRGVSFGNGQSLNLNSSFNLQIAGNLTKDIEIKAAITDNNIPIQPEGNTANIQDFDKVFIQLAYKEHYLKVGDFDIKSPESYFMRFQKNLQGLSYWGKQNIGNKYALNAMANISITRGTYTLQNIVAEEGNQGPYKLVGANGETFIIVLSGSERIFIDGELLQRGANKDYTIDYNLGEIRFTAKRLITKNLRIKTEFEYSANNYFRYMYHVNAGISNKIWAFDANFYSEQDVKNQAINQDLSQDAKNVLINAGDSLNNAFVSGVNASSFDNNRVLYEKIDTVLNGNLVSYYKYATDSTKQLYALNFTFLGEGKGNYLPIQSVANGRVYAWNAPQTGNILQGSYEPIVLLVSPKQKQLLTTRFGVKPTANTNLIAEFSLSNQDLNTFSVIDNEDDLGFGFFLNGTDTRKLKKDSTLFLDTEAAYEFKQKNFLPLERYRQIEFQRNWNVSDILPTQEHLGFGGLKLRTIKNTYLAYRLSFYNQDSLYNGLEHKIEAANKQKGWNNTVVLKWLNSKSLDRKTDFIRPKINVSKSIKALNYWKIGVSLFNEINSIRTLNTDSLSANSFWWQDYTVFVESSDSIKSKYKFSYNLRNEHLAKEKSFDAAYLKAHTFAFNGSFIEKRNHKLSWVLNYRNLQQDTLLQQNDDLEHFYLGRINYNYSIAKGAIVGNTIYEIGSGREQKIQYNYIRAPDGQGNYAWQDINENGVQELNEFYVSVFQNDNVFLRLLANSLEFQAVNATKFNQSLRINPKAVWFNEKGLKGFLARFSNITSVSLSKKIFAEKGISFLDIINPVNLNKNDTLLVSNSNLVRTSLFFNRNNAVYAFDYTFNYNQNVNLLTSGLEKRLFTTHALKLRWNINKALTLRGQYLNGFKNNESDFYFDRRYEFILNEFSTDFAWIYKSAFRVSTNYRYAFRSNPSKINGGQFAVINEAGIELKYTKVANFNLVGTFRFASVAYNDNLFQNEQLEIDMLQNLQNGNNYIWTVSFDKTIAKNFQISIVYDGRKTGLSKIIHTGRAQVRALF